MMKLKRVKQCAKCPWKKGVNPYDIPNGYEVDKHKDLISTIADTSNALLTIQSPTNNMACHETDDSHCVGWLNNQLGIGNNIGLRLQMRNCENVGEIKVFGEQHRSFEETLPE
jgi:hypothetical protein